jgi:hypothetical protein
MSQVDTRTPHATFLASLGPQQAIFSSLIRQSSRLAFTSRQTGFVSAGQSTMLWSSAFRGVMGFPGPFVPFPALGGPFSWLLVIGIFLGCTLTSTINTICPAFVSSPRHKSLACASVCFGENPSAAAKAVPA